MSGGVYTESVVAYSTASTQEKRELLREAREVATHPDATSRDPYSLVWALGVAFTALDEANAIRDSRS